MELSINVLGNDYQEERVWDSILQVHTKLNEQRRQKEVRILLHIMIVSMYHDVSIKTTDQRKEQKSCSHLYLSLNLVPNIRSELSFPVFCT